MQWVHESDLISQAEQDRFLEWLRVKEGSWPSYSEAMSHINSISSAEVPLDNVKTLLDLAIRKVVPQPDPTPDSPLKLPGYGLPLGYLPPSTSRFPVLMGIRKKDWAAKTLLVREVCMLKFMEDITNKPEWWRKVRDEQISAKWKAEAQRLDWSQYRRHGDFTRSMAVACMQELRRKAALYEETGLIPVLDYSACVIKSDNLMPQDLTERLKTEVGLLENVPEDLKDWHPGSEGKVLDLVHPSLWPLLYGRSRIMRNQRIGLKECLDFCGRGFLVPRPDEADDASIWDWRSQGVIPSISTKFQWLPCDVDIDEKGGATISSYINNLHPVKHAELYPVIQSFVEKSLPAWDLMYRWVKHFPVQRLRAKRVIVKLANIHLTPEKPSYDGGSWHSEGQLNEHICATALYYYDNENITESRLAFRAPANEENLSESLSYEQDDRLNIERAFAIRSQYDTLQDVGSVLTRPGRAIFFPNLFQHRVQPFSLADPSKPGHRKILALFLVDPAVPVISTANIPPQQRHWCAAGQAEGGKGTGLPAEVTKLVLDNMDSLIGEEDAKRFREELMKERTVLQENMETKLKEVEWSFCEH
ncbi:hypothetical protein CP533_0984 [Ophiocordyceps camponoti-saundersi (nom. inval.)]|nr:hypothetical protein CP533_0984 [Ophiocordyceps camponoti-saundersi (nom. inval.)]